MSADGAGLRVGRRLFELVAGRQQQFGDVGVAAFPVTADHASSRGFLGQPDRGSQRGAGMLAGCRTGCSDEPERALQRSRVACVDRLDAEGAIVADHQEDFTADLDVAIDQESPDRPEGRLVAGPADGLRAQRRFQLPQPGHAEGRGWLRAPSAPATRCRAGVPW